MRDENSYPRPDAPQTPMTGSGAQRRQLPQQDGNGESETDFGFSGYLPPADPETLIRDSHPMQSMAVRLARRRLPQDQGRRRL